MADVEHTHEVLRYLWKQHTYDQRLHLLTGALPLVALAWQAEGALQKEEKLFVAAGGRVLQRESDPALYGACWDALPDDVQHRFAPMVQTLKQTPLAEIQDDVVWREVRAEWEQFTWDVARLAGDTSLETFLSYANLMKGEGEPDHADRLGMMTVHAAKGKEFKVVFLVGLEEKEMPSFRATDEESLLEERRVAYVGMSRAADRLYLVGCEYRSGYSRAPSRFWRDLDVLFR
jgi:hypothetical protein